MADRTERIEWPDPRARRISHAVRDVEDFRRLRDGDPRKNETHEVHDVQELSDADMSVYEAVASLAVAGRVARLAEVADMTDRPWEDVRRSLNKLADSGWVVRRADGFALGPHDWGLDY